MIRLRVSDLDAWVRYAEPERDEFAITTDEFIARLLRTAPPTADMLAGTAFHALLGRMGEGEEIGEDGVEEGGFLFRFAADFELAIPPVREEDTPERLFATPRGPVSLQGRTDGRDGFTVTDYKLTGRFDAERYATSLQWRAYLLLTGCRRFRYLAFENKRKDANVLIHTVHPLDFWAYAGMQDEVERRVRELAEFVALHVPQFDSRRTAA